MKPHTFTPIGVSRHCTQTILIFTSIFISDPAHSATKGVVFSSSMKSSAIPETAYSVTEADIEKAMKKYCIPVDQFNCQTNKLAKWNKTTQSCDCVDTDGIWNPNTRECFKCQNGTYVNGYTCTPCHSATYSNWSASCGNATRTKTTYCNGINSQSDTANAKTITEKGNVGGCPEYHSCQNGSCVRTGCPAGQYLSGNSCINCQDGYYCPNGKNRYSCPRISVNGYKGISYLSVGETYTTENSSSSNCWTETSGHGDNRSEHKICDRYIIIPKINLKITQNACHKNPSIQNNHYNTNGEIVYCGTPKYFFIDYCNKTNGTTTLTEKYEVVKNKKYTYHFDYFYIPVP